MTKILIGINVFAFAALLASGGLLATLGGLRGAEVANGQVWRLITSGFLHADIFHIAFNMLAVFVLGREMERMLGGRQYLTLYMVSLLGGAAGALLLSPQSFTVGASGAVFGLMGALALVGYLRKIDLRGTGIWFWIGLNLLFTFTIPNISIGGHLGGLFTGLVAVVMLERLGRRGIPLAALFGIILALGAVALVMV